MRSACQYFSSPSAKRHENKQEMAPVIYGRVTEMNVSKSGRPSSSICHLLCSPSAAEKRDEPTPRHIQARALNIDQPKAGEQRRHAL